MQRARAFFYVCAGLFLLAVSYHLGAKTATAQATTFKAVGWGSVVVVGSDAWELVSSIGWRRLDPADMPPVQPSSLARLIPGTIALTESGEGWYRPSAAWVSAGVVPGGPTPSQVQTWGAVKSRYRSGLPTPTNR